ncbi:MAG: hypothetical protein WED09_07400 [Homoserinimonas sp.]
MSAINVGAAVFSGLTGVAVLIIGIRGGRVGLTLLRLLCIVLATINVAIVVGQVTS